MGWWCLWLECGTINFRLRFILLHVDIDVRSNSIPKHSETGREAGLYGEPPSNVLQDIDPSNGIFLRTNWQIQGYLQNQADTIEK